MDIEILRGEIERLFSLDELTALSRDLLGFDPEEIGGTKAKASFARALTDRCSQAEALDALVEAVIGSRPDADPRLRELSQSGFSADETLQPGAKIGPFVISRKLGEGSEGLVYRAEQDGTSVILKVLRREASRDARALNRFLTVTRLIARVGHPSLPQGLTVGQFPDNGAHYIAYDDTEGETLGTRIRRDGPLSFREARVLLRAVLDALAALHDRRIAHGNLKLDNIIVTRRPDGEQVILVDGGIDRLRLRARAMNGHSQFVHTLASPKTVAPEQIRGSVATPRADVYAFGAVLYEILTGKPVFGATQAVDLAVAHLIEQPKNPSDVAPRGWVPKNVDTFVLSLLAKESTARPRDARALLETFEGLSKTPATGAVDAMDEQELEARIQELLTSPDNEALALRLESAVQEGADPDRVAQAFALASEQMGNTDEDGVLQLDAKQSLLFRAARTYEAASEKEKAEEIYSRILELEPSNDIAAGALVQVRKSLGKFEEVIEMLLERGDNAESGVEKARVMADIGRIYAHELEDRGQAMVAYTQALCEDPETEAYADEVERLAGNDAASWAEVTSTCAEATNQDLRPEVKRHLFARLGAWYSDRAARPDLATACFQAILATNPHDDAALAGLCQVYEKAQQWGDLAGLLVHRAGAAPSPAAARNFNAEAAELFEHKLGDVGRAKELYQKVLSDDPTHLTASDGLQRILEASRDFSGLVKMLEDRAVTLRGDKRWSAIARMAQVFEEHLSDLPEATRLYEVILDEDPKNANALKGLDRVYTTAERYKDLMGVLERQLEAVTTPRQKIAIYERLAVLYEEEFIDHEKAAEACEAILALDANVEPSLAALIRHYRALERWEEVVAAYERQIRIVSDDETKIDLLLARGKVLLDEVGSPARALETFERVLALDPNHPAALDAVANLRAGTGNATLAVQAIEALVQQATTPEGKAEHLMRAAQLLEEAGDFDGAIERYKSTLEAVPSHTGASDALRAAYTARGDINAAVELIGRQVEMTDGPLQKARLLAESARLTKQGLKDDERAFAAATQANLLDPTNVEALMVLGDLAFEEDRFHEAATHYEIPANRADKLDKTDAARVLLRYVDALYQTGASEKALAPTNELLKISPDDSEALARVARVAFDHDDPKRAYELYRELLERFRDRLTEEEEAESLYRLGESARRAGFTEFALPPLSEAADLDPGAAAPLASLAKLFEAEGDWENVIKMKNRRLDVAVGEERYNLLIEIGEIFTNKLEDRTRAAKTYIAALEENPEDRNILTKLMQLYSEDKDWSKLVEVVVKLSDFVDDLKQKAKYLHTAAMVSSRQLGEIDAAIGYYERALELDPTLERALDEAIELRRQKGDFRGVENLLRIKLDRANEAEEEEKMLKSFEDLAVLYHRDLGWTSAAIDAYEAAQTLDPENKEREEILASLYASDPAQYLEKAVTSHRALLQRNPDRADSYKLLRRLYTETKRADASWCMCQALTLLNLASPDEERFFRRMRTDSPAPAQTQLTFDDFQNLLVHEDADPTLSALFLLIEPAILSARGQTLETMGYDPRYAMDLAENPHPMAQTIYWAASVLGLNQPPTFENTNDPGGLSFLHSRQPAVVLGRSALEAQIEPQAAAFIVARHLAYYSQGFYVRQLIPTGTGLKAWLFAAIKMISPTFPIQPELEGPMREALAALERGITGSTRERLASLVAKLLVGGGALDLKKWVVAVDLTADRAGFLMAHDLQVAGELIKASGEEASAASVKERLKELILFATSEQYFALRAKLGLAIDS